MSTINRDPQTIRLAQADLALNGWVGTLPMAGVAMGSMTAPLMRHSALCNTATAAEGQQAPLTKEPATHQD